MQFTITMNEDDLKRNPAIGGAIEPFLQFVTGQSDFIMYAPKGMPVTALTSADEKISNVPVASEEPDKKPEPEPKTDPKEKKKNEAPEGKEEKENETSTENGKYTAEDVRVAMTAYARKHGNARAKSLLQEYDVSRISDLDPKFYPSVMVIIGGAA